MISKSVIVGALVGTLALGLSGCVPVVESDSGLTNLGQGPGAATPSETAAPIEGDKNGDGKLSKFEKQVLAQNSVRDFGMPDGSVVKIDPKQPFPAEVLDVLTQQSASVVAELQTNRDFSPESVEGKISTARAWVNAQAEATGKQIVVVFGRPDGAGGWAWVGLPSGRQNTGLLAEYDRDSMVGKVQSWAERFEYEMIVVG